MKWEKKDSTTTAYVQNDMFTEPINLQDSKSLRPLEKVRNDDGDQFSVQVPENNVLKNYFCISSVISMKLM